MLHGCLQPGKSYAVHSDVLDRLSYLNSNGDKSADVIRYWFDVLANLCREMEGGKVRFDDKTEVQRQNSAWGGGATSATESFCSVIIFTAWGLISGV